MQTLRTEISSWQTNKYGPLSLTIFIGLSFCAIMWIPEFPPMADLPQHAGQVAALKHLAFDSSSFWSDDFYINLKTPYLTGYLFALLFSIILPTLTSVKIALTISFVASIALTHNLLKKSNSFSLWTLLTIPSIYGYAYYWGLFNFILAYPIGLLLIVKAWDLSDEISKRNVIWCFSVTLLLFFSHILMFGICGLIAASLQLAKHFRNPKAFIARWVPFLGAIPLALIWLFVTTRTEEMVVDKPMQWGISWHRALDHLSSASGYIQGGLSTGLAFLIVLCPILCQSKIARDIRRWRPFLICAALTFL